MARGLIDGIADLEVTKKQLHNSDLEFVVLRRFPFHECITRQAVLIKYRDAVQYMFQIVPPEQQIAVMGRFSRKLIKRYQELGAIGL